MSSHKEDSDNNKFIDRFEKDQLQSQRSFIMSQRSTQPYLILSPSREQSNCIGQESETMMAVKTHVDFSTHLQLFSMEQNEMMSNNELIDDKQVNSPIERRESQMNGYIQQTWKMRSEATLYDKNTLEINPKSLNTIQEIDQSNIEMQNSHVTKIKKQTSRAFMQMKSCNQDSKQTQIIQQSQSELTQQDKLNGQLFDLISKQDNLSINNEESQQQQQHLHNNNNKNFQIAENRQQQPQQSSILSSQSSNKIKRQIFIHKIMKVKVSTGLQILKYIGFFGTFTLLLLTILSYFQVDKQFQLEKKHFSNVSWPMEIRSSVTLSVYYLQYIKFQQNNIFSDSNDVAWMQFAELNKKRILTLNDIFTSLQKTFIESDQDDFPYFKNVTDYIHEYNQVRDYQVYNKILTYTERDSFHHFILFWYSNIKRFSANIPHTINEETIMNENFGKFNLPITKVQDDIEAATLDLLKVIEDDVNYLMIINLSFTFLIVVSILPVYVNIQAKNQEVLKLFSTFLPDDLTAIVDNLKSSIYTANKIKLHFWNVLPTNKSSTFNSNTAQIAYDTTLKRMNLNPKKKVISSMNQLKKLPIWISFACFVVYLILIIQPVVNSLLITTLIEQQQFNLKLMKTIYDMKAHFASNLYLNMGNLLEKMCKDCEFFDRGYFQRRVPVFFDLNQKKLTHLYEVVRQEGGNKRFNQELYDEFLFKIMEGSICEAMSNYPQFIRDPNFTLDYAKCNQIQGTILTKGFQISAKNLIEIFPPLFEMTKKSDLQQVQKDITDWEKDINLLEFDEFVNTLINCITSLKNFMVEMSDEYIQYAQTIELYLLAFYCTFLVLLIYFLWGQFYREMHNSLVITRQLLSLIDIIYLYQNPYIVTFVNKP